MLRITNFIVASVMLLLSASHVMAAEYNFKLHHFLSAKAPAHKNMLAPWAERIMKDSNGRIKIEIFPSMTLGGKQPKPPRQVRDGVVDMAWIVNAYAVGSFPRTEVFELPGVHNGDPVAVGLAMYQMYDDYLKPDFKGLFPLFQHVHAGQALHMVDDLIRSPADLKGKKIRIPSRTGAWIIQALGANPTKTSVGEIPSALSKKVIDGALIPFEIIPPLKIHQQTKYQIEGPNGERFGTTTFQLAMNTERWNKLPADIQKIFLDNSGADWHAEVGKLWLAGDVAGIAVAVKSGNEHIKLTKKEWRKFEKIINDPITERWIKELNSKNIDGEAIYKQAVKLIKQNSKK